MIGVLQNILWAECIVNQSVSLIMAISHHFLQKDSQNLWPDGKTLLDSLKKKNLKNI